MIVDSHCDHPRPSGCPDSENEVVNKRAQRAQENNLEDDEEQ